MAVGRVRRNRWGAPSAQRTASERGDEDEGGGEADAAGHMAEIGNGSVAGMPLLGHTLPRVGTV
jgi:hypothetical protein